jgi:hypothetical protein
VEKIKIRGLAHISSWILGGWGAVVFLKSLYDLSVGEPEANLYAPQKWAFVTQEQWRRYAGFELCYGLALLALAWSLRRYARLLPEFVSRKRKEPEFRLFE